MTKQIQLDGLRTEIIEKKVCEELSKTATQLVMGSGNPDADIVLIGEAPGKSEDEKGLPFVGASGKFLDVMLAEAGLEREDIYITNIVKYRPPNNRDPLLSEKVAFWPYLVRQLEIINPKIIATLGRHSLEFFIPGVKIGEVHGQVIIKEVIFDDKTIHEWKIVPLYHPAAALYNGSMRSVLKADFKIIAGLV